MSTAGPPEPRHPLPDPWSPPGHGGYPVGYPVTGLPPGAGGPQPGRQPPWSAAPYRRSDPTTDLPDFPAQYHQVLRGPRHRWWRPLLSLLLLGVGIIAEAVLLAAVVVALGAALGKSDPIEWGERLGTATPSDPGTFLLTNLSLILLIPLVIGVIWVAHHGRPGYLLSVAGRFRWGWFGRCLTVLTPLWVGYLGVAWLVTGAVIETRPQQWAILAVMALLLTPLQAAAEEVAFRGWFLQSIGSWFPGRRTGLVVAGALSITAFALAHGSWDPWILADLAAFGVVTIVLTWQTGGLEAAIALHAVNNVIAMQFSLAVGGFDEGFVDATATGSLGSTLVSVLVQGAALILIVSLARRRDLQRRLTPAHPSPLAYGLAPR